MQQNCSRKNIHINGTRSLYWAHVCNWFVVFIWVLSLINFETSWEIIFSFGFELLGQIFWWNISTWYSIFMYIYIELLVLFPNLGRCLLYTAVSLWRWLEPGLDLFWMQESWENFWDSLSQFLPCSVWRFSAQPSYKLDEFGLEPSVVGCSLERRHLSRTLGLWRWIKACKMTRGSTLKIRAETMG